MYCEVIPCTEPSDGRDCEAIILSGDRRLFWAKTLDLMKDGLHPTNPFWASVMESIAFKMGGEHSGNQNKENTASALYLAKDPLFGDEIEKSQVWMSHGDDVKEVPSDWQVIARVKMASLRPCQILRKNNGESNFIQR